MVVAQGLAENVKELHEFLYPDEPAKEVSDTVQMISEEIALETGVVRPPELDAEPEDGEGETPDGGSEDGEDSGEGSSGDDTEDTEDSGDTGRPYVDTADAEFVEE